jgi:diguanylate cyclase (GGDEF)-like protein
MTSQDSMHLLLIEQDRGAAGLIDEMLRESWSGALSFTVAQRIEDVSHQLAAGVVSAVLLGSHEQFGALERVRVLAPGTPVIVLSSDYSDGAALVALRAGAQDVLAKAHLTPTSLRRALQHAIERMGSNAHIAQRALEDPLTGLPNRTLFIDRLGVALERTRRTGSVTGVLFLDVDGFKVINDSLGHAAGDRLLTALAGRLQSVLRPMDTVARFGGDEFTFLLEDLSSAAEALAIAERIEHAITAPIGLGDERRQLGVSIGVATTSDPRSAPDTLIAEADAAMYQAKRRGGGAELIDDVEQPAGEEPSAPDDAAPLADDPVAARQALGEQLRRAIARSELRVLYQPRYRLGDERHVVGFEALVRWQHPQLGLILPAEFLPLADELGLTSAIGQFVLGQSLELLARLQDLRSDLTVSINASVRQLGAPELAAALAAVDAAGVRPADVCVDITEQTVSAEPETVLRAARLLKAAGIRVAIDDYGTGAASLRSLRSLKADELKIAPSFIGELDSSGHDATMVAAVVELGHALGMRVTAEGVETDEQLIELRSLGCDAAQGFLLSRPMAADQLEELIAGAH